MHIFVTVCVRVRGEVGVSAFYNIFHFSQCKAKALYKYFLCEVDQCYEYCLTILTTNLYIWFDVQAILHGPWEPELGF